MTDAADRASGEKALVLFSGGQDSTTCLAWALDRFAEVETIGFDYGQRHRVEMPAGTRARGRAGAEPGLGGRSSARTMWSICRCWAPFPNLR